tara:strand:- start:2871 stop:3080 length:210 start_codon:yes stop_codon:yes gene_type:complete
MIDQQITTANDTLCCAYCGKYLGFATSINYIDGEPGCAMCRAKVERRWKAFLWGHINMLNFRKEQSGFE